MLKRSAIALIGIVSLWAAASFAGLGVSSAVAAGVQPGISNGPSVLADLNRGDCDAIRGTDYLSDEERSWFLSYCIGGGSYSSAAASQPQVVYVYVPVPQAPAQPVAPTRPTAPSIRIVCTSSQGSAVANDDYQNVPLNAFAGEPIYCNAAVNGSYTSIDWAAASNNGSGANFTTNFSYRTTPWTIRVQINWGGNPVIRFFSVTTVNSGCFYQPGYGIC